MISNADISCYTHTHMFPCDVLPTSELRIELQQKNIASTSTGGSGSSPLLTVRPVSVPLPSTFQPQQIEESSGLAILNYLYDREKLFEARQHLPITVEPYADSFLGFMKRNTSISSSSNNNREPGLFERAGLIASLYPSKTNLAQINKRFLMQHQMTINELLTVCEVPITDLWKAGITRCYRDLQDLKFQMRDLTVNKECFKADHMVQLFQMNARTLAIDLEDLLVCKFTPAELVTLQFSLPDMIEQGQIRAQHLKPIGYSLEDLILLGFSREHLKMLNIGPQLARDLRWSEAILRKL